MNILILTVSAGNGHVKSAEIIKKQLEKIENTKVKIVDTLEYVNPFLSKLVVESYLSTLKVSPDLYGKLYAFTNKKDKKAENESDLIELPKKLMKEFIPNLSEIGSVGLSYSIKELIKEENPDLIICTHPTPAEIVSILKEKNKIKMPLLTVITDYTIHNFWIQPYTDAYIIANEDFEEELLEREVSKEKIFPLGIPIDDSFLHSIDKKKVCNELDLDGEKLIFLILGGGLGLGDIKVMYKKLLASDLNAQIIVVTGNNKKLNRKITEYSYRNQFKENPKKTVILGFTNEMHKLMSISNLIISKPGGLTVTEAIVKKVPFLIISPIPGQEEDNSEYLLNSGMGIRVSNAEKLIPIIKNLFKSSERQRYIKEMQELKSKPNSTKDICELVRKLVGKSCD